MDSNGKPPYRLIAAAIGLVLLVLAVAGGGYWLKQRDARNARMAVSLEQRLGALEARAETLSRDLRSQAQRLQDSAGNHRVLRDEVLALDQRGALLEENLARLANAARQGPQSLRLDEAELLLSLAAQRLQLGGDLESARRAYALAQGTLAGVDDPALLNLKHTLAQERDAVDALGSGAQATVAAQIDRIERELAGLPVLAPADAARPAWQRWLSPLLDIRSDQGQVLLSGEARNAASSALQLELALLRGALQRNDRPGFEAGLQRIDALLPRLWPPSPALAQCRQQLQALRSVPLASTLPMQGSALQELRALRRNRPGDTP